MFFCLIFDSFSGKVADGIFSKHFSENTVIIEASGSSKQEINGSLQLTKPEYSIYPYDKRYDWCSECGKSYDVHPWIAYSLKSKSIKISGYFVRAGCCYYGCCCEDYGYCVHCCMYSWSFLISNDNQTWTEIHRIDKDLDMRDCKERTYMFDKEYTAKYIKIVQNEPCPGDPPCLAINRLEIFGESIHDDRSDEDFVSFHDDDEDVSIIGHISKNGKANLD